MLDEEGGVPFWQGFISLDGGWAHHFFYFSDGCLSAGFTFVGALPLVGGFSLSFPAPPGQDEN